MVPTTAACSDSPRLRLALPGTPWNPLTPPGTPWTAGNNSSTPQQPPSPPHSVFSNNNFCLSLIHHWLALQKNSVGERCCWWYEPTSTIVAAGRESGRCWKLYFRRSVISHLRPYWQFIINLSSVLFPFTINHLYPQQTVLIFNSSNETEFIIAGQLKMQFDLSASHCLVKQILFLAMLENVGQSIARINKQFQMREYWKGSIYFQSDWKCTLIFLARKSLQFHMRKYSKVQLCLQVDWKCSLIFLARESLPC